MNGAPAPEVWVSSYVLVMCGMRRFQFSNYHFEMQSVVLPWIENLVLFVRPHVLAFG
jgi:hypothetical protein